MSGRGHEPWEKDALKLLGYEVVEQDVELRLEVSLLRERMRVLEEVVLAQEGTIERLKRDRALPWTRLPPRRG